MSRSLVILLKLSLLVFAVLGFAPVVYATPGPVFGAGSWVYLDLWNGRHNTLLIALIIGLAATLLMINLLHRSQSSKNKREALPADASAAAGQRRAWARVQSYLECRYFIISHADGSELSPPEVDDTITDDFEPERGLIVDLSAGGCRLAVSRELQAGDELEINLELEPRQRLNILGQVTRIEKETNSAQIFVGVQFKDLREAAQDQIIAWMFKHQQSILEGQRRLREGLCLRCGRPLETGMRQQTLFCSKCDSIGDENNYLFF